MNEQAPQSIRKAYHPELVILAVEDHTMFSKDIKHALPQHRVIFARTLEEARQRYDECLPDAIFLDLDLPDGNGFDFLDYVRTKESDAYFIVLTGSKMHEDIATAEKKAVQDYIIKPCTRSKIQETIEKYLIAREKTMQGLITETEQNRAKSLKLGRMVGGEGLEPTTKAL